MYSFEMKCKIFVESHVYNKIKKNPVMEFCLFFVSLFDTYIRVIITWLTILVMKIHVKKHAFTQQQAGVACCLEAAQHKVVFRPLDCFAEYSLIIANIYQNVIAVW